MTIHIRPATPEDLRWLDNGFDEKRLAEQVEREIEEARTATPTPRHWRPVRVAGDPSQMAASSDT